LKKKSGGKIYWFTFKVNFEYFFYILLSSNNISISLKQNPSLKEQIRAKLVVNTTFSFIVRLFP